MVIYSKVKVTQKLNMTWHKFSQEVTKVLCFSSICTSELLTALHNAFQQIDADGFSRGRCASALPPPACCWSLVPLINDVCHAWYVGIFIRIPVCHIPQTPDSQPINSVANICEGQSAVAFSSLIPAVWTRTELGGGLPSCTELRAVI